MATRLDPTSLIFADRKEETPHTHNTLILKVCVCVWGGGGGAPSHGGSSIFWVTDRVEGYDIGTDTSSKPYNSAEVYYGTK